MKQSMLSLVIVDDNLAIRQNLKNIFSLFEEVELLEVYTDGTEVVAQIDNLSKLPDIVLMDLEMKLMGGIEATAILKAKYPQLRIVMLTISENSDHILHAITAGADGYLIKGEQPLKMLELLKLAAEGRMPMSPLVVEATRKMLMNRVEKPKKLLPSDFDLSKRELEVLQALAKGANYNQIADQLNISPQTVRSHTDNIYKKLDVHSKVELTMMAMENQWL